MTDLDKMEVVYFFVMRTLFIVGQVVIDFTTVNNVQ
jgi:hypothetical protein